MTPASSFPYLTVPPGKGHDRTSFACGDPEFDRSLRTQSSQDAARTIAAVYVAADSPNARPDPPARIHGYYTLSSHGIVLDELPDDVRRRLPRHEQAPAVLLGRLAVDVAAQRTGLGRRLVFDAVRRVIDVNEAIAAWAIVVDARTPALVPWYVDRFGFIPVLDRPTRLFLPVRHAAALLESREA